ncbi:MAG: hypothetical protein BroJett003_14330 [Planctomycetota bacterium]|nr:MAG: hypothetical protein BroJett003_14330 [Planctomycetota bacterium]
MRQTSRIVGWSVERRPIRAYVLGELRTARRRQERRVRSTSEPNREERPQQPTNSCLGLLFGAIHGDEPITAYVMTRLVSALQEAEGDAFKGGLPSRAVVILPVVNPDGLARRTRRNARRVDLNRNFPTKDWAPGDARRRNYGGPKPLSEPESRTLYRLVLRLRPRWIVAVHTINRGRFCNNYDGPGEGLARAFAACNGYPVTASIGYPTPGSFGTWAGRERGIPVLTLELPSHHSRQRCWSDNEAALSNVLFRWMT